MIWFLIKNDYNSFSYIFLSLKEMKYTEIQKHLEKLQVFGVHDLRLLDDKFNKSKIADWKRLGYIQWVIRWFYLSGHMKVDQNLLFKVSNTIYAPSYISLESAFSYYWIIPEQTFSLTAVSTNKTKSFESHLWYFQYQKIKSSLFWWYQVITINQIKFLIAEPEKAILDYLYLNTHITWIEDFEWLRINTNMLKEKINKGQLLKYTQMFGKKTLTQTINILLQFIDND